MPDENGAFTKTPNWFYDELLPQIKSLAELKVTEVIIRQTIGYGHETRYLSHTRLMKLTGLSSRSVRNGINDAVARGYIWRECYGLSFVYGIQSQYIVPRQNVPTVDFADEEYEISF